jgi:hypothetical protein
MGVRPDARRATDLEEGEEAPVNVGGPPEAVFLFDVDNTLLDDDVLARAEDRA